MVRSLAQWTKTLSFPSRLSPNRNSKDCSTLASPVPPPTPPRNKVSGGGGNCATSRSSSSTVSSSHSSSHSSPTPGSNNNNNMPITELEQIVSLLIILHSYDCYIIIRCSLVI